MFDLLTKKWISMMVETDNGSYQLEEKLIYLKENQIRCKLSNVGNIGKIDNGLRKGMKMNAGFGMNRSTGTHYVSLDVHCKDVEKAKHLLDQPQE